MNSKSSAQVPIFSSDGLSITAAEPWFKVKVQVLGRYVQSFIAHVAGKADDLILIDLAAGSGLYSYGHQKEVFAGAGLSMLSANLPISKWIFCEPNAEHAFALKSRVEKHFSDKDVWVVDAPREEWHDTLRDFFPKKHRGSRTAVLCLADPFSMDIPFTLMDNLVSLGASFLMPFTWPLNDRLNYAYYRDEHGEKLKRFLGIADSQRLASVTSNEQFYRHVVRMYQNNMLMLGLNTALSTHKLESQFMRLPAFYIGFFSRQFSTKAIQRGVVAEEQVQFELF